MKLSHIFLGLLLLATPALGAEFSNAGLLDGGSIFSRVRGMPGQDGEPPQPVATTPAASTPAPRFVGTFQERDQFVAFIEVHTARDPVPVMVTIRPGDIISWDQSRVLEITSDHLQLSNLAGGPRIIKLGYDLQNRPVDVTLEIRPSPSRLSPLAPNRRPRGPVGRSATLR